MKKLLIGLLALLLMGLWQQSMAQMPGDTEEPPRLKKKKPKTDMPDPPPMPEKKKDPADDDTLDPRAEVPAQDNDTKEQEVLRRVAKNSRSAEERLLNRELGDGVRQLQDDILKDLDELIAKQSQPPPPQNDQEKQNQGGSGGGGMGGGGTGGGGTSGGMSTGEQQQMTRRQERKQRERERTQTAQHPQGGSQPQPMGGMNPDPNNLTGTNKPPEVGGLTKPHDPRYDMWGHLSETERLKMNRYMDEKFMDKYDELTRQYYRTIAEKSRKGK